MIKKLLLLAIISVFCLSIFADTMNIVDTRYTTLTSDELEVLIVNQGRINRDKAPAERVFIVKNDNDLETAKQIANFYNCAFKIIPYSTFLLQEQFDLVKGPVYVEGKLTADNLSFYKSFEITIPTVQFIKNSYEGQKERDVSLLLFIPEDEMDFAINNLTKFLDTAARYDFPCSISIPYNLPEIAPALYQLIIAKSRMSSVELITINSPVENTKYGLINMELGDDLKTISHNTNELKAVLKKQAELGDNREPFMTYALRPESMNTADLAGVSHEINAYITPVTWLQGLHNSMELIIFGSHIIENKTANRLPSTITVSAPELISTNGVTDADELIFQVKITGDGEVGLVRFVYRTPDGREGFAHGYEGDNNIYTATLPPMLSGGELSLFARVVQIEGAGVAFSPVVSLPVSSVDTDGDGLSDTFEKYLGTNPNNIDTDGDGLIDSLDPYPTSFTRMTYKLTNMVKLPNDDSHLVTLNNSIVNKQSRIILPGGNITYAIPLQDIPKQGDVTLRVLTKGSGNIKSFCSKERSAANTRDTQISNTGLYGFSQESILTDIKIKSEELLDNDYIIFTVSSTEDELEIYYFELTTNHDGPFLASNVTYPTIPVFGQKIGVRAFLYPDANAASVWWGTDVNNLKENKMVQEDSGTWYVELPDNINNHSLLAYTIAAEDKTGNKSATPYNILTVGTTNKETLTFQANRDFLGTFSPSNDFKGLSRTATANNDRDTINIALTEGTYYVWILANTADRALSVEITNKRTTGKTITVGSTGKNKLGWIKLGEIAINETVFYDISVIASSGNTSSSYAEVVLTRDISFHAPVATPFEWYDSILLNGINDNDTFSAGDRISFSVAFTGNIDQTAALLRPRYVTNTSSDIIFSSQNNRFSLNTTGIKPGEYTVYVYGQKTLKIRNKTETISFLPMMKNIIIK